MSDSTTLANRSNGRQPNGRFAKGCAGGPGNPAMKRMYELRKAIVDAATDDEVRQVAAKLRDLALDGDTAAAKLWLSYVAGQPAQTVELTGLDGATLGISVERLQIALLAAVGDLPEARERIARSLRQLVSDVHAGTPERDSAEA